MALLKVIGDFLEVSGWSLQKGSQTSRSQWAHQITAAALYILQRKAYDDYRRTCETEDLQSFHLWSQKMVSECPQFCYWNKVLQLECLLLAFARWLTVHVTDLQELPNDSVDIHRTFVKGNFVTQKSSHKFSALAHDHIHEQQNAIGKGDGRVIGITENEAALRRWMVAGSEIARIVSEFEDQFQRQKQTDVRHHKQLPSVQKSFASDLNNAISSFEKLGNPFAEDSNDLYVLDTKVIMPDEVIATMESMEETGKTQFDGFVEKQIKDPSVNFYDNISKNNLPLFKSKSKKTPRKSQAKITIMKSNVELFSRLYISCQARDAFFEHECYGWPPALAEGIHTMRPPTSKADLVPCLEAIAPRPHDTPKAVLCILDGAALLHQLEPKKCNRVLNEETVLRVDVVWDTYRTDSLKGGATLGRGTGIPLHVTEQTSVPKKLEQLASCRFEQEDIVQFPCSCSANDGCSIGENTALPSDWGWEKNADDVWHPFWTVMTEASKGCRELTKCKCKKLCAGNCKFSAASLPCTELCVCSGQCFQDEQ
ncbi:hypothetical protein HOLleu_26730 [Holothuria leucospilota]|uniref:Tesmin/TSO1-like CXC domain-containing protein n=1 Tax=Holothuria leucospilota TaxID=206669 RepID=A0A9Q1H276_HOLLE|nr:hypothetical protein HOLleu_26730 [Holothuria leucospilota]